MSLWRGFKIPILQSTRESDEILYCSMIYNEKRYHFIAIAGTNRDDSVIGIKTWIDNLLIFINKKFRINYPGLNLFKLDENNTLTITGHSRGGMIAQIITEQYNSIEDYLPENDIKYKEYRNFIYKDIDIFQHKINKRSIFSKLFRRKKIKRCITTDNGEIIGNNNCNNIYLVTFASPKILNYDNWTSYAGDKDIIFLLGKKNEGSIILSCRHSILTYYREFVNMYKKVLIFTK